MSLPKGRMAILVRERPNVREWSSRLLCSESHLQKLQSCHHDDIMATQGIKQQEALDVTRRRAQGGIYRNYNHALRRLYCLVLAIARGDCTHPENTEFRVRVQWVFCISRTIRLLAALLVPQLGPCPKSIFS